MKHSLIAAIGLALLTMTAAGGETTLESIKAPSGKNLLAENMSKTGQQLVWSNHGGKKIQVTRSETAGRKILKAVTDKPGYHLGLYRQVKLKPGTRYLLYVTARGKITGKDSKIIPLYLTDARKGLKSEFLFTAKHLTKDFPWQRIELNFRTPADPYEGGTAGCYLFLFYGQVELEIADAGLIELGEVEPLTSRTELEKKYPNILNNPEFASLDGKWPADWNQDFEDLKTWFRFEKSADGKNTMVLLPKKDGALVLVQKDIKLNPGKKYRLGAMVKTDNLPPGRGRIVVYNTYWTAAEGINTFPVTTNGKWKRLEADITLPKSLFNLYSFAVYTVGNAKGTIHFKDPYLIPLDAGAAQGIKRALSYSRLNKITPVKPLLAEIDPADPKMEFSFRYFLPANKSGYSCRVSTKMNGAPDFCAPRSFPVKDHSIKTTLPGIQKGKGFLKAEIVDNDSGKVLCADEYPIKTETVSMTRKPVPLNMLVNRLLSEKTADGTRLFTNPRNGWVYIRLTEAGKNTRVLVDGKEVIRYREGKLFETIRDLKKGDHRLTIVGSQGGETIVNSVPAVLAFPFPDLPGKEPREPFQKDFPEKYIFPNVSIIFHQYPLNRKTRPVHDQLIADGKKWINGPTFRSSIERNSYVTPDELVQELKKALAWDFIQGCAFDEVAIDSVKEKALYTETIWKLAGFGEKPLYTCLSGKHFAVNGLNVHFLSGVANACGGSGKIFFEIYAPTQPSEAEAEQYFEDEIIRCVQRAGELMPDAMKYSFIINGGYTNVGQYNKDCYAGPDVKYFWDMYMNKLANRPEFKNLYGIGLYGYNHGNEESIRWAFRLFRHYFLEGRRDSLARQYGYTYNPGFIPNGDFEKKLAGWEVRPAEKDSIRHERIPGFGAFQRRRAHPAKPGDNVCVFKRSAKAPNYLSVKLAGLKPGELYALRYTVTDNADRKAGKPSGKKLLLPVRFDGAENVSASTPAGKYLGADGIHVVQSVNNVVAVFKPSQSDVTVTFTDWQNDTVPGAAVGQELLLNLVRVCPYYRD